MNGQLLKLKDVARRLACSEQTVRRLISAHKISYVKIGSRIRISESTLNEYIAASTITPEIEVNSRNALKQLINEAVDRARRKRGLPPIKHRYSAND